MIKLDISHLSWQLNKSFNISRGSKNTAETIEVKLTENKFIGIGETGLDFHYNNSDKFSQINSFEKQIEIAQDLSFPIVIHMRNAENEMLEIIKKNQKKKHFK